MPTTYTPSSKELEELGFSEDGLDYYPMKTVQWDAYILYNTDRKCFILRAQWEFIDLYPRDKAHLQSLILAFQPK